MARLVKGSKGQTVVEFALVLPVMLLVLFGIAEFGRIMNAYLTVEHAAREGARLGAVGATDLEIASRVDEAAVSLDLTRLTVGVGPVESERKRGTQMWVSVSYSFPLMVPLISSIVGDELNLSSTLRMRVE